MSNLGYDELNYTGSDLGVELAGANHFVAQMAGQDFIQNLDKTSSASVEATNASLGFVGKEAALTV